MSNQLKEQWLEARAEAYMEEGYDFKDACIMAEDDFIWEASWEEYDHQDKEEDNE